MGGRGHDVEVFSRTLRSVQHHGLPPTTTYSTRCRSRTSRIGAASNCSDGPATVGSPRGPRRHAGSPECRDQGILTGLGEGPLRWGQGHRRMSNTSSWSSEGSRRIRRSRSTAANNLPIVTNDGCRVPASIRSTVERGTPASSASCVGSGRSWCAPPARCCRPAPRGRFAGRRFFTLPTGRVARRVACRVRARRLEGPGRGRRRTLVLPGEAGPVDPEGGAAGVAGRVLDRCGGGIGQERREAGGVSRSDGPLVGDTKVRRQGRRRPLDPC